MLASFVGLDEEMFNIVAISFISRFIEFNRNGASRMKQNNAEYTWDKPNRNCGVNEAPRKGMINVPIEDPLRN